MVLISSAAGGVWYLASLFRSGFSEDDPLDLIQGDLLAAPVVELGRAGAGNLPEGFTRLTLA
jgi:hypothetical protein